MSPLWHVGTNTYKNDICCDTDYNTSFNHQYFELVSEMMLTRKFIKKIVLLIHDLFIIYYHLKIKSW